MPTCDLKKHGKTFLKLLETTRICSGVDFEAERAPGQCVPLDRWRDQIADNRKASVGKAGIYLDCSMTGSGKSYADRAAMELTSRAITVSSTHEQCAEIVNDLQAAGFDAVAFPLRTTSGNTVNCWNEEADRAEAAGLPVIAAVCGGCPHRDKCGGKTQDSAGYVLQVKRAKAADVVVATHARVRATGMEGMTTDWPLMFIHEDATDVLFPLHSLTLGSLEKAQTVISHLLGDPKWLNWLGRTMTRDSDGNMAPLQQSELDWNQCVDQFIRHLDCIIGIVIQQMNNTEEVLKLPAFEVIEKPNGIEWLLWNAQKESQVTFDSKESPSPWAALTALATDDSCVSGILVDDNYGETTVEKVRCDAEELTITQCDRMAV